MTQALTYFSAPCLHPRNSTSSPAVQVVHLLTNKRNTARKLVAVKLAKGLLGTHPAAATTNNQGALCISVSLMKAEDEIQPLDVAFHFRYPFYLMAGEQPCFLLPRVRRRCHPLRPYLPPKLHAAPSRRPTRSSAPPLLRENRVIWDRLFPLKMLGKPWLGCWEAPHEAPSVPHGGRGCRHPEAQTSGAGPRTPTSSTPTRWALRGAAGSPACLMPASGRGSSGTGTSTKARRGHGRRLPIGPRGGAAGGRHPPLAPSRSPPAPSVSLGAYPPPPSCSVPEPTAAGRGCRAARAPPRSSEPSPAMPGGAERPAAAGRARPGSARLGSGPR